MTPSPSRRITDAVRCRAQFCILAFALAAALLISAPGARATLNNGEPAIDILGQFSSVDDTVADYTKACADDEVSQIGFGLNGDMHFAFDIVHNRLFVGDCNNNRVLVFALTSGNVISSKTPANVLGQPDLVSCGGGSGNTSQSTLYCPVGLAYDGTNDRLFVGDQGNDRVMVFNTSTIANGMNAAYVLGQANFSATSTTVNQSTLNAASGVALDSTSNLLYVADLSNNRVMVFNVATGTIASGENASYEMGQPSGGSAFTTSSPALTQSGMNTPYGLAFDSTNSRLFVGEINNNRVLAFNTSSISNGMNAANELGQPSGTAFTSNTAATTQSGMTGPLGVAYDGTNNRLFVVDGGNNRVLAFNTSSISNGMNAASELGQPSGTAFTSNTATTTQSGLTGPSGAVYDSTNNQAYVGDAGNARVMIFGTAGITNGENASDLLGQYTSVSSTATATYTQNYAGNGIMQLGYNGGANTVIGGEAMDPVNHYLYVTDTGNNRVLVYALNTDNSLGTASGGHTPSYVLGQTNLVSGGGGVSQSTFNNPVGLAFDAVNTRLFVTDQNNHRVLVFSTSSLSNAMNASYELGQPSGANAFTTHSSATTRSGMQNPSDVAFDAVNERLFVADSNNNRVTVFNVAPGSIANGENASNELGQPSGTAFTSQTAATTRSGMHSPQGVAFDAANERVFVADQSNSRVTVYAVAPASIANGENASNVLGQANYTSNGSSATQSMMTNPESVSYDPNHDRLFVGDYGNERVMVFNVAPGSIANGENAANVLGQPDFTTSVSNTTQPGAEPLRASVL